MNIMNAITMSTTTMFMSGRGYVAFRGGRKGEEKKECERLRGLEREEKDGADEEEGMVTPTTNQPTTDRMNIKV